MSLVELPGVSQVLGAIRNSALYKSVKNVKFFLALLPLSWLILFCVIPLTVILKISFANAVFGIPPFSEVFKWSVNNILEITLNIQNYLDIINDSYYMRAFINSVALGTITTVTCAAFGFAMAYGIHCVRDGLRTPLLLLVSLSFWTSFLIRVYSWINMLSAHGIVNSFLIKVGLIDEPIRFIGNYYMVCIGLIFCYLPLMIFPIYSALDRIDKSCVETAWNLGCRISRTFWTLIVPMSMSGLKAGCLLVGTASVTEFVVPELLGGSDSITFGRVLWIEFFNNLDWPMTCAVSISIITVFLIPLIIRKSSERERG
jgi:putrescine transport system permease protein